ncbi:MAG TPA: erythromycin esterase family protein, partial [Saprospiraceae bacterium]|nr:erythromycin esterase family protein [Saprospiraceae bacterium]
PAIEGSWEEMLHGIEPADKLLLMNDIRVPELERMQVPHRAIGVVYNPETEKKGNYVPTLIPLRYDAFMFFDKTTALNPLHISTDPLQMPETFPFGL